MYLQLHEPFFGRSPVVSMKGCIAKAYNSVAYASQLYPLLWDPGCGPR